MKTEGNVLAEVALPYEDVGRSETLSAIDFEEVYRNQSGRMKSVARNLLGNVSDAEDAVQEAFVKLHRSLPRFRGESLVSSYLYRILVNTCHDIGRARKRRFESPEVPADDVAGPVTQPSDPVLRGILERGMATLAPRERAVFVLVEVEGFTHRETADILAIPEGTSKHALFKAKRHLQARLASRLGRGVES
jgi:RNA polymerase sigma-70 factor, ECF subfamily